MKNIKVLDTFEASLIHDNFCCRECKETYKGRQVYEFNDKGIQQRFVCIDEFPVLEFILDKEDIDEDVESAYEEFCRDWPIIVQAIKEANLLEVTQSLYSSEYASNIFKHHVEYFMGGSTPAEIVSSIKHMINHLNGILKKGES